MDILQLWTVAALYWQGCLKVAVEPAFKSLALTLPR